MAKIIINNESVISDLCILDFIQNIISMGLVSKGRYGKQYCFATTFNHEKEKISVFASKTKTGTHTFHVI